MIINSIFFTITKCDYGQENDSDEFYYITPNELE